MKMGRVRSGAVAGWCCALLLIAASSTPVWGQLNQTQHDDGWILAAAHTPGLEGSIWRTDLWVRFRGYGGGTITLRFCRSGVDNTGAPGYDVVLDSETQTVYVEDVVEHFLHVGDTGWLGAIHYTTNADAQVYARVYSTSTDGRKTYGQLVEGIPTSDMSLSYETSGYPGTQEDQWMFALKHTADNRYRVNIGIVNPTAVASRFWVNMFDATNDSPGGPDSMTVQVPPFSMIQLNDPFAGVDGGEWSANIVRVEAEAAGSGALAYASVVDNATNDAFFVRGVKLMRPDE
jgi:hypothetical protein